MTFEFLPEAQLTDGGPPSTPELSDGSAMALLGIVPGLAGLASLVKKIAQMINQGQK
jgi:hypothetical protein